MSARGIDDKGGVGVPSPPFPPGAGRGGRAREAGAAQRRGVGREPRAGDHGRPGQGGETGPVRCAPVVVAPGEARGLGSPQGVAALPLMVYITMALARWWWWQRGTRMGCCVGGAGAGALALRDRWSMGGGCASVGPGRHLAAHQGPAGKRQDRGQGTANRLRTGLSWVPGAAGNTWPRRLRVTALLVRLAFWAPGLGRRTIMSDGPV
jgi:hypothetical protein